MVELSHVAEAASDTGLEAVIFTDVRPMAVKAGGKIVADGKAGSSADARNIATVERSFSEVWGKYGNFILEQYGKPNIDVIGSDNLDDHFPGGYPVAAYGELVNGMKVLLGDRKLNKKISQFAKDYGISVEIATAYTWLHELAHARGHDTEAGAEEGVKDFAYATLGKLDKSDPRRKELEKLIKIAEHRIPYSRMQDESKRLGKASNYGLAALTNHAYARQLAALTSGDSLYLRAAAELAKDGVTNPYANATMLKRHFAYYAEKADSAEVRQLYQRLSQFAGEQAEIYRTGAADDEAKRAAGKYVVGGGKNKKDKDKRKK